jgi:hypothetical protein
MSGLTGAGNTVTNDKLNFLNVNALSPETLYTNSMILQAKNFALTGQNSYIISIAPPELNQTTLYNKLITGFIGCTVSPRVTSGYTGYTINWGSSLLGAGNLNNDNITSTTASVTWLESPDALGRNIIVYLDDAVTVVNPTITNLSAGFFSLSGLTPGTTYFVVLVIYMPSGSFGTGIRFTTPP